MIKNILKKNTKTLTRIKMKADKKKNIQNINKKLTVSQGYW